jgi:hypothetical protein
METLAETPIKVWNPVMYGIVESVIAGPISGHVRVMGVTWKARLCIPQSGYILVPGMPVIVFGCQGDTLLVLSTEARTEAKS